MRNYYGPNLLGAVRLDRKDHLRNPYPKGFEKVDIPPGKSGDWEVRKFNVTPEGVALHNLRLIRDGRPDRVVPPGSYTKLIFHDKTRKFESDVVVMSDTPAEANEHRDALRRAHGSVLINGLGLGFFLDAVLRKPDVTAVTVVEKSRDVIKLVGSRYAKDPRVTIVQADAVTWKPPRGTRYDFAWHDIWNDISGDNKPQMRAMKTKYRRVATQQACWSEAYL